MKGSSLLLSALLLAAVFLGSHDGLRAEAPKQTAAEARAEFAKADKALNDAYAFAKKKLVPRLLNELQRDQREWVHFREELALTPSYSAVSSDTAVAKQSAQYFRALTEITKERIAWIDRWIAGDEFPSLTAKWRDSHGGYMELVEEGDKLHFIIQVARGRAPNIGAIAGTAEWNGPIGWFSDKGREKDKTEVTNLAFISRDRKIEVIGAKTEEYHGHNAFFDGLYIMVGRLEEKDRARVLKAAETGAIPEN
jgi:uncharacterized protein YecT (DUF1311 family)